MITRFFGWLLNLPEAEKIESFEGVELSALWASESPGPFWVFLGIVAVIAMSLLFYLVFQKRGTFRQRLALGFCRSLILLLIFLALAMPVAHFNVGIVQHPYLYLVFDGTNSMAIRDQLTQKERDNLAIATGIQSPAGNAQGDSRLNYLKALIGRKENNLLKQLQSEKKYRLQAFLFEGNSTSRLRRLELNSSGKDEVDPACLAEQLTDSGQVTALGTVLSDLSRQIFGKNSTDTDGINGHRKLPGRRNVASAAPA